MSTFEVPIVRIRDIEPIPGADFIELAVSNDYRSVVRKGDVQVGDLAAYIPEGAILQPWLIERLGLTGKLAGGEKNRVKAVRLKKVLSQGIIYPVRNELLRLEDLPSNDLDPAILSGFGASDRTRAKFVTLGENVAEVLSVTKWEPPVPTHMAGEVANIAGKVVRYDIENLKRYPEKLHGTLCEIGIIPGFNHPELFFEGDVFVASKGLGGQGLVFKNNDQNANNLYVKALLTLFAYNESDYDDAAEFCASAEEVAHLCDVNRPLLERLREYIADMCNGEPLYIFGEIVGIQDLKYGAAPGKPFFRLFNVARGNASYPTWFKPSEVKAFCRKYGIEQVPILYEGPWSREIADQYVDGKTTLGGGHIREGIVITVENERYEQDLGRVILKHVSADYLTRRGEVTEYN